MGRTQQISFSEMLFVRKQASKNNLGILYRTQSGKIAKNKSAFDSSNMKEDEANIKYNMQKSIQNLKVDYHRILAAI